MNDNSITGVIGLGFPCEDCGGTGVKLNVWVGHLGICPTCNGDGFYCKPEAELPEPEPAEYDADKAERQHEATLDAVEDEANLKAYRAEHGDDAPEPMPTNEFKFVLYGNEGEQDLYIIESVWHEHPAGAMYLIERRDGDGILYTHYVLGHHLQRSENDPCIAIFMPILRAGHDLEPDTLQPQIATLQCEVDGLNYQLQTARAAQDQLRDELVAVTAERDALKLQLEMLNVLPIAAQEAGRYREALETILRRAQGGLEYRNVVTLRHRLNEIVRYAEVALNPAE